MKIVNYLLALSLLPKPIISEHDTSKDNRDIKILLEVVQMSLSILLWYEKELHFFDQVFMYTALKK